MRSAFQLFGLAVSLGLAFVVPSSCRAEDREIYNYPGWDSSMLPGAFFPLKSGVALKYHLDRHDPPAQEKARLVADFLSLREYERHAVLGDELWPRARCDDFISVLEPLLISPDVPEHEFSESMLERMIVRLVDLKSQKARELVLADIRRPKPLLSIKALTCLPDKSLPAMESAFRENLRCEPNGDLKFDPTKVSAVISRYGTIGLLSDVRRIYLSKEGRWSCDAQAAMLHYLIKYDLTNCLELVEHTLLFRGGPGQNNCFRGSIGDTLNGLNGAAVEEFVLKHLDDPELNVSYSAACYLIRNGSTESRDKVIRFWQGLPMVADLAEEREPKVDRRSRILGVFFCWPEHFDYSQLSRAQFETLLGSMTESERQGCSRQIAELRKQFGL